MIKQIMSFLVEKWPTGKSKKKKSEPIQYVPLSIHDGGISFGYAKDGESIHDLL